MTVQSFGGVADFALVGVNGVFDAPPELDDVEAAAFTLPFHTGLPGGAPPGQAAGGEDAAGHRRRHRRRHRHRSSSASRPARTSSRVAGGPEKGELCAAWAPSRSTTRPRTSSTG